MTTGALVKKRTRAAVSALIFGSALSMPAGADQNEGIRITFDEALALGATTPGVRAVRGTLEARQQGDEKIRGAAEATHLTFMPGALVVPSEIRGFDVQATITQGWNLGGLGRERRESARLERSALSASVRTRALRARLEAARRWIDLATLQKVSENVETRTQAAETLVERRRHALAAEVGTSQSLTESRAVLAQLRQRRLALEGDQFAAATQLALAVGRAPAKERLVAVGESPEPILPDLDEIRRSVADIESLPDVVVARLRETAAQARAIEASAEYAPVLTTGVQAERPAGDLRVWVVYGIAGLSFRGPGQERRTTSMAHSEAVGAGIATDSARLEARAELEDALHELEHTEAVLELLERETLPALHELVESRSRAVALGEQSYFAVFDARDQELAVTEAAHRARGAHTWARVRMWLLLAELSGEGMI